MKSGFYMGFKTFYHEECGTTGMTFGHGTKQDMIALAQRQMALNDGETKLAIVVRNKDNKVVFALKRDERGGEIDQII